MADHAIETLQDVFQQASCNTENGITFIPLKGEDEPVSYRDFSRQVRLVLGGMQASGLRKGNQAILFTEDIRSYLLFLWGCIMGGIVPFAVQSNRKDPENIAADLTNIADAAGNPFVLATVAEQNLLTKVKTSTCSGLRAVHTIEEFIEQGKEGQCESVQPSDRALVVFSSGSTGTPKGVILTHNNIVTNVHSVISRIELCGKDRMLSWLPLTHVFGTMVMHFMPMFLGIPQCQMSSKSFAQNPVLWMEKVSQYRATMLASPNFGLGAFLKGFDPTPDVYNWDLSSVKMLFNGAESVSCSLCRDFLQALEPYDLAPSTMHPGYGMSEVTVAISVDRPHTYFRSTIAKKDSVSFLSMVEKVSSTTEDDSIIELACVGEIMDCCEVRVCDDADRELGDLVVGAIQVRGTNVTSGYIGNDAATQEAFTEDGWLRTGDIGFMEKRCLTVTGRMKEIIIIGGHNIYPQDIEKAICSAGILPPDEVVVCGVQNTEYQTQSIVVFFRRSKDVTDSQTVDAIKKMLSSKMALLVEEVVPVDEIPYTHTGKVQRHILVKQYLAGEHSEALQSLQTKTTIDVAGITADDLRNICCMNLGLEDIGVYDNFIEAGADSKSLLTLTNAMNRTYGISMKVSDFFAAPNIMELRELILSQHAGVVLRSIVSPHIPEHDIGLLNIELSFQLDAFVEKFLVRRDDASQVMANALALAFSSLWNTSAASIQVQRPDRTFIQYEYDFTKESDISSMQDIFSMCQMVSYTLADLEKQPLNHNRNSVRPLICSEYTSDYEGLFDLVLAVSPSGYTLYYNDGIMSLDIARALIEKWSSVIEYFASYEEVDYDVS